MKRKTLGVILLIAAACAAVLTLHHIFPVARMLEIGPRTLGDFHTRAEIMDALYIGSAADRAAVAPVINKADKAFGDIGSTWAENEAEYGLLARYAASVEAYPDAFRNEHELELWSAHLEGDRGLMWVFYSSETFDEHGALVRASVDIPSLWSLERDASGEWAVVGIKEHP